MTLETIDPVVSLKKLLSELGFLYFVGGSRRFGYNNEDSDTDIFVYTSANAKLTRLEAVLTADNFTNEGSENFEYIICKLFHHKDWKIHLGIISNYDRFLELKKQHEKVEEMLRNNPALVRASKILKEKLPGSTIYQILCLCLDP